jgi:hypothetical protein
LLACIQIRWTFHDDVSDGCTPVKFLSLVNFGFEPLIYTQLQVLADNLTGGKSFFSFGIHHAPTASHAPVDQVLSAVVAWCRKLQIACRNAGLLPSATLRVRMNTK